MSGNNSVGLGRWVGVVAVLLALQEATSYVLRRLLSLATSEVQARGGDVAFVLGLAEKHRGRG